MKYDEQLLDSRWITKRDKILNRDHFKCKKCNSSLSLNVHHIYYIRGNFAWEYPMNALITLCNDCHHTWHKEHDIEIREKVFTKNKIYEIPHKKPRKDRIKPSKTRKKKTIKPEDRYIGLDYEAKRRLIARDKQKLEIIKSFGMDNIDSILIKTRSFTVEELKQYLINK